MKWICGIIVLANVALYMWGLWYHQPLADRMPLTPRPDVAHEKMKLLSEPGARLVLRTPSVAPAAAEPAASDAHCFELGPFRTLEKARVAGTKLDAQGLGYTRLAEYETLGPSYRVYLPPFPSKEAAERKRRELTALGFTDHALIQQEEGMENAISLGIFSVEQNAIARVRQLARKKINALIQPIPNVHPVYWLALSAPETDGRLGTMPIARFADVDWGSRNVELRPIACGTGRAGQ